jgi:hypothetical protein
MIITTALLFTALCVGVDQGPTHTAAPVPTPKAESPQATAPPPVAGDALPQPVAPSPSPALDARHRIEVRFGGWANGWSGYPDDWHSSGSAQGAFGLEYLSFVRNDLGIGIAVTGLGRAQGDWDGGHDTGSAQMVSGIPVVVRWYPIRRLTRTRSVEPYVTAGIGPVFGVDTAYVDGHGTPDGHWTNDWPWTNDWHNDDLTSTRVATTVGGRVGGGVDFRLGSVFTLGVSGAWNWDAGFPEDLWRGARPNGGEFTVVLGWNFGR